MLAVLVELAQVVEIVDRGVKKRTRVRHDCTHVDNQFDDSLPFKIMNCLCKKTSTILVCDLKWYAVLTGCGLHG